MPHTLSIKMGFPSLPCKVCCPMLWFWLKYSQQDTVGFLFSALKIPAPSLPLTTDGEWETSYFQGSWEERRTAGGSRNFLSHWQNPCFPFTVCDESTGVNVRITLHQCRPDTDLHPIGFHIYKVSQTWGGKSVIEIYGTFASVYIPLIHLQYNLSRISMSKRWHFVKTVD